MSKGTRVIALGAPQSQEKSRMTNDIPELTDISPMPRPTDAELVTITPEVAIKLLDHNFKNRKPRPDAVARYARDMSEGRWRIDGATITMDRNGTLQNGQHRLRACISANVPFVTLFQRGLDPESIETVDSGVARTISDRFKMDNYPYSSKFPSIISYMASYAYRRTRGFNLSVDEVKTIFHRNEGLIIGTARQTHDIYRGMQTVIGSIYVIGHILGHSEKAEEWLYVWRTGESTYPRDPVKRLREQMDDQARAGKGTAYKKEWKMNAAAFIWNEFVDNRKRTYKLTDRSLPERPYIRGWSPRVLGLPYDLRTNERIEVVDVGTAGLHAYDDSDEDFDYD